MPFIRLVQGCQQRLRDDDYELAVVAGHLVISHVPYVDGARQVRYGTLVSVLDLSGDQTIKPRTHVAYFAGDYPCDQDGNRLSMVVIDGQPAHAVTVGLTAAYTFSHKPVPGGAYADYHHKVSSYVAILSGPAQAIDPHATARTHTPVTDDDDEAVFNYIDTASSRAGIAVSARNLAVPEIAIIGLGGTGSYILDLVAKTPVGQIHLFDGDDFLQHNAFRAPGAPTLTQLRQRPAKVDYLKERYSAMHRGVVAHPYFLDASNVAEIDEMAFVFLAIDDGLAKETIVARLEERGIPFVDVGMGIYKVDGTLAGLVRATVSAGSLADRDNARARISFGQGGAGNEYSKNIQIADLNALNAALAVIAWKKLAGFYNDLSCHPFTTYAIDTGSTSSPRSSRTRPRMASCISRSSTPRPSTCAAAAAEPRSSRPSAQPAGRSSSTVSRYPSAHPSATGASPASRTTGSSTTRSSGRAAGTRKRSLAQGANGLRKTVRRPRTARNPRCPVRNSPGVSVTSCPGGAASRDRLCNK
jgi:ThiF family